MSLSLSDIPYKGRMLVAALVVTGGTLVSVSDYEGYFSKATIPVKGDVYTYGHGTTRRPDGKPVQKGDTITPQRAMRRLNDDLNEFANQIRKCITAPLYLWEWGAFLSLAYNIGGGAFCAKGKPDPKTGIVKPTLIDLINSERYAEACAKISEFNHGPSTGKDKHGNKIKGPVLKGLVLRRASERAICEGKGEPSTSQL